MFTFMLLYISSKVLQIYGININTILQIFSPPYTHSSGCLVGS
jgi:hypothetical protein